MLSLLKNKMQIMYVLHEYVSLRLNQQVRCSVLFSGCQKRKDGEDGYSGLKDQTQKCDQTQK